LFVLWSEFVSCIVCLLFCCLLELCILNLFIKNKLLFEFQRNSLFRTDEYIAKKQLFINLFDYYKVFDFLQSHF
jgi:hypothetical protein